MHINIKILSRTPPLHCYEFQSLSLPAGRYEGLTLLADKLKGGSLEQHPSPLECDLEV